MENLIKTVKIEAKELKKLRQDWRDMYNSHRTIFIRCKCGRLCDQGLMCPTNLDGGYCESGL